jgi:signal transduction histidine kinase
MIELPSTLPTESAFFTHVLNTAHMGIATLQPVVDSEQQVVDFTVTYVNESAHTILGNACNHDLRHPVSFTELFPQSKSSGFHDSLTNVFRTGRIYANPELIYTRQGKTSWYDIHISRYEHTLAVMIIDVTERKQAQLAYQRQVEFLDGLLTTSSSGIIVYDAIRTPSSNPRLPLKQACEDGEIQDLQAVFFNAAFEQIVSEPAEKIRNRSLLERVGQSTYSELIPYFTELMKSGTSLKHERYFPHLGKWLAVSGTGLPNGFALILDDVTARKEAESVQHYQAQELHTLNQELLRSNENLMEFSYVASHDLQEPLRKIRQFGSMMEDRYGEVLGEEGTGLLHRMQSAADRMSALIRDLLDYSRLSRQHNVSDQLDLNELVSGVMTALELEIAEKKAIVTIGPLGKIIGNSTQLAQAFQNLLTNALKFAKPGQPPLISISSKSVDLSQLPYGFQPTNNQHQFCALEVVDKGIGFDQTQADRIFGAFQRLHTKSTYPGTGIGLAIVKKVVENHGGCITAQSQPGQGASFIIYLPTTDNEA